jgi:hypothetical protein
MSDKLTLAVIAPDQVIQLNWLATQDNSMINMISKKLALTKSLE